MMTRKKEIPKSLDNKYYKFMKGFAKISISDICRDLEYNRSRIMQGYGTSEQYILIKEEIENRLAKLYIK